MDKATPNPGNKHRSFLIMGCIVPVLLVLFVVLLVAIYPKTGRDSRLPAKYYGSSWECTEPSVVFSVDDTGSCFGTIAFENKSMGIEVALLNGGYDADIFVSEGNRSVAIFSGKYEATEDRIVLSGEWSPFLEERYNQPYEEGECTLIFERK